jgi:hypothetical protein
MARSPGKIALYELVNKARFKSAQQKALSAADAKQEQKAPVIAPVDPAPRPGGVEVEKKLDSPVKPPAAPVSAEKRPEAVVKSPASWSARPKPVRVYADRLELCFSWQVIAIAGLTFVVILLVFFKLGQIFSTGKAETKKSAPIAVSVQQIMPKTKPAETVVRPVPQATPKVVEPMGDNVIVITSYKLNTDLEPVKQHFTKFGIATEIIKRGSRYMLITQNRFNDIEKPGTDGYEMKRKIMSIGASYKPPAGSGFESFGTKPFQDVYGMKLE